MVETKTAQYVHDIELHFTEKEKRTQTRKLKRFVPRHTQGSKENIFQDIKAKHVQYGYFPGSGKVALIPCPHLPTRRKCVELYTPQNSRY